MPYCPKCGTLLDEGANVCSNCGYVLEMKNPTIPESSSSPLTLPQTTSEAIAGRYVSFGLISAFLSLFIVPEILGSAAIILGAASWKREVGNSKRGLYVLILGIIFMLVGIYYTSFFGLYDILP